MIADVDDTLTLDNSAAELLAALGVPLQRLTDLIRESESGLLDQAVADQRLLALLTSTAVSTARPSRPCSPRSDCDRRWHR